MGKFEKKELVWAPATDPVSQASLWVPERLYPKQVEVCREIMQSGARVACVTPNESGKTSVLIPVIGLSFMAAFPGSQVVSTAGVERQIREQLWPVLRHSLSKYPNWTITDDLKIKAPSVGKVPGSTWEAFTTKDPNYAEGFHPRLWEVKGEKPVYGPLMVIIDEAKSFTDDKMFKAFVRCDPDIWVVISTPGEETGPFYDCFHTRKGKPWKTIEIGWHDCPHLRVGRKLRERQEWIDEYGENDPFVMSGVFGRFFRTGGYLVFDDMIKVDQAMSGMIRSIRGDRKAAMDFSGGGDAQTFAVREGNTMLCLERFHETDTIRLGDLYIEKFKEWDLRPQDIIGDNGGLGKPIIDYLESRGYHGIHRYMVQAAARSKTHYVNRGSEDHFELRFKISEGLIGLTENQELRDQMRTRRYERKNDDSNMIRVESKEKIRNRGGKSPDELDTVVMLFSTMPSSNYAKRREDIGSLRCGYVKDVWSEREDSDEGMFGRNRFEE